MLTDYLRRLIQKFHHLYIVLDALDESPRLEARGNVLDTLEMMQKWSLPGLHLLVTSRNEPDSTRPTSQGVSVIDLALSTVELSPLILWEIPEKYPALSDDELILLGWEDIDVKPIQAKLPVGIFKVLLTIKTNSAKLKKNRSSKVKIWTR